MPANVTKLPYIYRDEHNCKQRDYIYLNGRLSHEDVVSIMGKLNDGDGFIPFDLKLGIPELQERIGAPSDADHVYHELEFDDRDHIKAAPEGETLIDVADFLAAFAAIKDENAWDEEAAMDRLGLNDLDSDD